MNPAKIVAGAITAVLAVSPALAQGTKVAVGISGWTGFAPLVLAKEAGIYAKNGLDVSIKKIPQASRHLAIASGDVQCAATTVETWIVWNANGVATTQLFQMDKSYGADGMGSRAVACAGSLVCRVWRGERAACPGQARSDAIADRTLPKLVDHDDRRPGSWLHHDGHAD